MINEAINGTPKINLPDGDHDAVLRSEPHREMVETWTMLTEQCERLVLETYGEGRYSVSEVVPVIAFASIARVTWALCSAAAIAGAIFDPVEFGRSCERIAQEQTERYRTAHESNGSA